MQVNKIKMDGLHPKDIKLWAPFCKLVVTPIPVHYLSMLN